MPTAQLSWSWLQRKARVRRQNGRNNCKLILHWSQSMEKQFSLQTVLDIKRWLNKAVGSSFFTSLVCIFILLLGGVTKEFHVSLQK